MRRALGIILIMTLVFTSVSCSRKQDETPEASSSVSSSSAAQSAQSGDEGYHHEFLPHVYAGIYEENFSKETKESFFSFCDAVLTGGEEFYCPDEITMYNVVNTISAQCMPLAGSYLNVDVGKIEYTIPKDQYLARVEEFKALVVSILDECIKPGYDDVDKALALYTYFGENYTYDYEAAENDDIPLSSYRLLTEKTGICQEIAPAYAYLMLQAGVDCTTCGSLNSINEAHEWAFATLDGEYYHIDPTWVITSPKTLAYFGMTDEKRGIEGGWDMKILNYGAANIFDDRGEFKAGNNRFEQIWDSSDYETDYDNNTIVYHRQNDTEEQTFHY